MDMPTEKFLELAPKWLEGHRKTREMCERGMRLCAEGKTNEALELMVETERHLKSQDELKKEILVEVLKFDRENAEGFIEKHGIDIGGQEEPGAIRVENKTGEA